MIDLSSILFGSSPAALNFSSSLIIKDKANSVDAAFLLFLISKKASQVSLSIQLGIIYISFFCIVFFGKVTFIFCVTAGLLTFVDDSANSVDDFANFG